MKLIFCALAAIAVLGVGQHAYDAVHSNLDQVSCQIDHASDAYPDAACQSHTTTFVSPDRTL